MRRLFDKDTKYVKEAFDLDIEISDALDPIMRAYEKKGFSIREIYNIVAFVAMEITTNIIIDNDEDRAQQKENEKNGVLMLGPGEEKKKSAYNQILTKFLDHSKKLAW